MYKFPQFTQGTISCKQLTQAVAFKVIAISLQSKCMNGASIAEVKRNVALLFPFHLIMCNITVIDG